MRVDKIYFDMDGVLADFSRGVRELCGIDPRTQDEEAGDYDTQMFEAIRKVDHFYDRLEMIRGSEALFQRVRDRYGDRCEILTAVPKPKRHIRDAAQDKVNWIRRLLSDDVKINIVMRQDKKEFCTGKTCVLIDDFSENIQAWEECGGTGILYKDARSAQRQLEDLGIL